MPPSSSSSSSSGHDEVTALANYLLDTKRSALVLTDGVLEGKRVQYFRGNRAVKAVLKETYEQERSGGGEQRLPRRRWWLRWRSIPGVGYLTGATAAAAEGKMLPAIGGDERVAREALAKLVLQGFIFPAQKLDEKSNRLRPAPEATAGFQDDLRYVWVYEGPKTFALFKSLLLVAVALLVIMFPMWPLTLRIGVSYLATLAAVLVAALMSLVVVRYPIYYLSVLVVRPGLWVFPNLVEDVGFFESFQPVYVWWEPKKKPETASKKTSSTTATAAAGAAAAATDGGTISDGNDSAPGSPVVSSKKKTN